MDFGKKGLMEMCIRDSCCVRRYYQLRVQQAFYFQEQ